MQTIMCTIQLWFSSIPIILRLVASVYGSVIKLLSFGDRTKPFCLATLFATRKTLIFTDRCIEINSFLRDLQFLLIVMSLKIKVWTLLDIALRVPPIFLMDKALKYELRSKDDDLYSETDFKVFNYKNNSDNHFARSWITQNDIENYGFTFLETLLHIQGEYFFFFSPEFNTKKLKRINLN